MTSRALILATAAMLLPAAGHAMTLEFPGNAVRSLEESEAYGSYELPLGAWQDGRIEALTAEGAVLQQVWKIPTSEMTTLQLLNPLRQQLTDAGYDIAFECADDACGGFDFRFGIDVASEPAMHVDLGDYRFLSARRPADNGEGEALSLLVSRSNENGFVQITHVGPATAQEPLLTTSSKTQPEFFNSSGEFSDAADNADAFGDRLETEGFVVLSDLIFDTGSAALGHSDYNSLGALAGYLLENPARRVSLVGHTDAEGSLSSNVALSKRRARSVLQHLVTEYGIDAGQLSAEGMGFLSPRASNLTDEGRQMNRRVEVILTSID